MHWPLKHDSAPWNLPVSQFLHYRLKTHVNTYKLLVGEGGQISTFGGDPSPPPISCNASISFTNSCCCFWKDEINIRHKY